MGILASHRYGMQKLRNLFGEGGEILVELRFKRLKDEIEQVYRVRCLKRKTEDKYLKFNDDGTVKEMYDIDILIEDLIQAKERRSEEEDCITSNFRDAKVYIGSSKFSIVNENVSNGNFKDTVTLTLERVI